jgi:tetratricopeptide (TPR) repeat protein
MVRGRVWLRERRAVVTWVAAVLAASGIGWVVLQWWRTGDLAQRWLDLGDRLASMISAVLTAIGVVLAYLVWRRPHGPGGREAAPAPVPDLAAAVRDPGGQPRQLPREASEFTGRTAELEQLLAMMPDPRQTTAVVISAIDGMAGIGKTTLAVYAAHRMRERFPDGQLFIDLHGFTHTVAPVEPAEALDRLLRMLGVPGERIPAELDDRAALWRSTLAGRRMLIVLDNAATEAQVAPLLPGEPGCLVLVTSRRRLAGLEATHTISLDTLPVTEAVALFAATAGKPQLATQARELLLEAAELCGHLPLAIRIAAARLQSKPSAAVAELVTRLRDEELRLSTLADPEPGGRSVTTALQLSYQQLSADEQHVYRWLGLHPGPDFEAYAVAALADSSVEDARRWLDQLLAANLLQEPVPGRYGFHDLVRAHARHTAAIAEPDPHAALRRLLDYYRSAAAAAMDAAHPYERAERPRVPPSRTPGPAFPDPASALGWLDTELPNLLAAARSAIEHDQPEHLFHLSTTLHGHLYTRGRYHDVESLHHQALAAARAAGRRADELNALNGLGHAHRVQGHYEQAAQYLRQALRLARAIAHRTGELKALAGLGWIHQRQGQYEQAVERLQEALQLARAIEHRTGELQALHGIGHIHRQQGRYEQANDHLQQVLRIARAIGHATGEQNALNGLAQIHLRQGRYEQAAQYLRQSLELARTNGNRTGELNALSSLGQIHQRHGRHDQAVDHYQQSLRIARTTGHRPGQQNALTGLAHVHRMRGQYDQAADYYRQLLSLAQESGDANYEFEARQGMGRLSSATGNPDAAIALHEKALALAGELGQPDDRARAHDGLAHAYFALRQPEPARRHWQQALNILNHLGIAHTDDEQATVPAIRGHLADLEQRKEPRIQPT